MKRLVVLVLLGSSLSGVGTGLAAASASALPGQVCVVVWNDPNNSRDGICVVTPDRPR